MPALHRPSPDAFVDRSILTSLIDDYGDPIDDLPLPSSPRPAARRVIQYRTVWIQGKAFQLPFEIIRTYHPGDPL